MKIYMFRHGETFWNRDKNILKFSQEVRDCYLTELGIEQAKYNAEFLKNFAIKHIYSSCFRRAIQTAEFLANKINIGIDIVKGFEECNFYSNKFFGLTFSEIKDQIGVNLYSSIIENRYDYLDYRISSDCETKRESRTRFFNAVKSVCDKTEFDIISISTHGNVLRGFLRTLNYEDDSKVGNCEVIEVDYNNERFEIVKRIKIN